MSWYEKIVSQASQEEQRKLLLLDILTRRALASDPVNAWALSLAKIKSRELLSGGKNA